MNHSKKITYGIWGSIFQGVIMEKIPFEYGQKLHLSELKPYSQFILNKNSEIIWTVNTLNDDADKYIMNILLSNQFSNFYLKHKNIELTIIKRISNNII